MKNTFAAMSEVIGLAWCDKTSFDDIYKQTGLSEREVIEVMRQQLKPSSFRMWRRRVTGRLAKHRKKQIDHAKHVSQLDKELVIEG
jgi:uncharacterized protein (TIGR03643 family)